MPYYRTQDPQISSYFHAEFKINSDFDNITLCEDVASTLMKCDIDAVNNIIDIELLQYDTKYPIIDFINIVKKIGLEETIVTPSKCDVAIELDGKKQFGLQNVDYKYVAINGRFIEHKIQFDITASVKSIQSLKIKFENITMF